MPPVSMVMLGVRNIDQSLSFYRDKLGFTLIDYFMDPPVYAMLRRDEVEIHFGKGDGPETKSNQSLRKGLGHDLYIIVSDVGGMFHELTEAGVEVVEGPVKRIYGSVEIVTKDCYGFTIVLGD